MVDAKLPKFDTLSLHAGQQPDPATGARAVPIYQTTSYVFPDTDFAASLFNLMEPGFYTPLQPTTGVLEERIAALEGGVARGRDGSGQAALALAVATLTDAGGQSFLASIYGGSHISSLTPCRASASRRHTSIHATPRRSRRRSGRRPG